MKWGMAWVSTLVHAQRHGNFAKKTFVAKIRESVFAAKVFSYTVASEFLTMYVVGCFSSGEEAN